MSPRKNRLVGLLAFAFACVSAQAQPRTIVYVPSAFLNNVSAFVQNSNTGALSPIGSAVATGLQPSFIIVVPSVLSAYVANKGTNDITPFKIDPITGALTQMGPPVPAGTQPVFLAMDGLQQHLYVVNSGSNDVSVFAIGATGTLTSVTTVRTGNGPSSLAFDLLGHAYVTNSRDNSITEFNVDLITGMPAAIGSVPVGSGPQAVAVDPSTGNVYVSLGGDNDIEQYTEDSMGILHFAGRFTTGAAPSSIDFARGSFGSELYVANSNSNNVSAFGIGPTGALSPVAGSPFAAGTNPVFAKVDPSGKFLYVANFGSNDITGFQIADVLRVIGLTRTDFDPPGISYIALGLKPPILEKAFKDSTIRVGGVTTLTFTIRNPNQDIKTGIAFEDILPAGLELVPPGGYFRRCEGGLNKRLQTATIRFASAFLDANGSCTFTVDVIADGTAVGNLTNTTRPIFSNDPGQGNRATATIFVDGGLLPILPNLTIAKTHSGNFIQGQSGATYSIGVSNGAGAGATSGLVTVTDTVPSGLTFVSMAGAGWTCPGTATNNCTRTDALVGGISYPPITTTVNVGVNATSPQVNMAGVSGGGSAPATAMDSATITPLGPPAVLGIAKTHVGNFTQGQLGALYTLTVSNGVGVGPTVGPVTVTETLPSGLVPISMLGAGWACPDTATNNCTRNDVLAGGQSFPPITVTVNVAGNAPNSVTNTASVSGGGAPNSVATDPTFILQLGGGLSIILSPITLNPGEEKILGVSLSARAGSGGAFITLTSSDPSILSLSTASPSAIGAVLIPPGATTSNGIGVVAGKAGPVSITATAPGYLPAILVIQVGATGGTSTIAATGGTPQSAATNAVFASPLIATLSSGGNPVAGALVTFTAPAIGASGTFAGGVTTATAITNASGVATSPAFTANSIPGSYAVLASAPGVVNPAAFFLTNVGGSAILLTPITLHPGDTAILPVSLSSPAADAVFVTLTSSDPSIVSLSTATSAATAGVEILAGQTTSNQLRVAAFRAGTVTITATAPGYTQATVQLLVAP